MELMDVTLRESVYYGSGIDYAEGLDYLRRIDRFFTSEEIKYIEICYINTDTKGHLNYDGEYIKQAYDICRNQFKLVGMMHPGKADINEWDSDVIRLLSMVRIVCGGNEIPESVKEYVDYLHSLNVEVGINISFAMKRDLSTNKELCKKCVEYGADYVYFADSSGSAYTNDIKDLCEILQSEKKNNKIGFHLHDHLSMSFANAIELYKNNIDITDVSITGAGRGGGNLKTEFMIPFLKINNGEELDENLFIRLLRYIDYFNALTKRDGAINRHLFLDTLSGIYRLGLKQQETIELEANGDGYKYIDLVFKEVK